MLCFGVWSDHADEDVGKISSRDLTAKIQLITPLFSVLPDLF